MGHVILLGDSIFDNASYVPGEAAVIDQLRQQLPSGWRATLLAVDGDVTTDVAGQLDRLPGDATHLIVSAGGNDALGQSGLLHEPARSVAEVLAKFAEVQAVFRRSYRGMLQRVVGFQKPTAVCTVYDSVPGMDRIAATALSLFNDVIVREACAVGASIIDLRLICTEAQDYSAVSPIEPSCRGGDKIARVIAGIVTGRIESNRVCKTYGTRE